MGVREPTSRGGGGTPREFGDKGIGCQGSCDFHSHSASRAYESFYLYTSEQMTMGGSVWLASE